MTTWDQLTNTLPPEQREELAQSLLAAMAADCWSTVEIETRDHHLHALNVKCSRLFAKPVGRPPVRRPTNMAGMTKVTCAQ